MVRAKASVDTKLSEATSSLEDVNLESIIETATSKVDALLADDSYLDKSKGKNLLQKLYRTFGTRGNTPTSQQGWSMIGRGSTNPKRGSFTTRDPAFAKTDTEYTYAGGDPINRNDPGGLCWSLAPGVYGPCPPAPSGVPYGGSFTTSEILEHPDVLTGMNPADLLDQFGWRSRRMAGLTRRIQEHRSRLEDVRNEKWGYYREGHSMGSECTRGSPRQLVLDCVQ